jgi:RsiW-degrading membrane proteinase PrsW (M82 family)
LLWGLGSGAGFGIAEAVLYSGQYYNGVSSGGIYMVRFFSCVALHAIWTGSAAITLHKNQHLVQQVENWYDYIPVLVRILFVPMVLHGLYDTLLKKEMSGLALGVAALSFLFLAFQLSRLQSSDDDREHAAMLREYERRRKSMATS